MEEVGEPTAVCTVRSHRGEMTCADVSGAWLAAGGGDGAVRLWRWRRGVGWEEAAGEPRAHRYGVTAARWAPTGVLLATAGVDGAARLWAVRTLRPCVALPAPHAAAARSVCWATSERLLVGHDDGVVRVWRVWDAALLASVRALEGAVYALSAFDGAALLLAACTEGVLKIYNLLDFCSCGSEGGSCPVPLVWEDGAHDLGVLCADSSACGRAVATGGQDARIRIWRAAAGSAAAWGALGGHGGAVTALRWARGTALLVSASLDHTARVWAVDAGVCLRVLSAHARYLTSVVVPQDARYFITGSNDKTIRTWSLSTFSIDEDLEPECSPSVHYGQGDLKGIGPVDEDLLEDVEDKDLLGVACGHAGTSAACAWRTHGEHGGAVNCVAAHGSRLATACSDGGVRIFKWSEENGMLLLERTLCVHQYPVLSVDFGANGALLLSAGLDGHACLWDVETGCQMASLWAAGGAGGADGGVRCARLSHQRAPLLLLGTDAGVASLWTIDCAGSVPMHVYPEVGGGASCTCAAWTADGAAAAAGGAAGTLQLLAPPPRATELCRQSDAHDLGVLSCDFAPDTTVDDEGQEGARSYLLASGGMDELVKLWAVEVEADGARGALALRGTLAAHGGAVQSVRWGARLALATSGADRWARVWRVTTDRRYNFVRATQMVAVPAGGAGGAPAAAFLGDGLLAVGSLGGRLALWQLPCAAPHDQDAGVEPRWWGLAGVLRWLTEYVIGVPGAAAARGAEEGLLAAARACALTGTSLLDEPLDRLLECFGFSDSEETEYGDEDGWTTVRARLLEELQWLRRPSLSYEEESCVPHALLCALTHAAPRHPVRAADGYTYERAALAHWLLAAGAVSPVTARRLRGADGAGGAGGVAALNRGVLLALRVHLSRDTVQQTTDK